MQVNQTSTLDQAITELYEWLKERNFESIETSPLKLILSANKNEGRCVISTKNVEPNTSLIQMPVNLLINHRLAFKNNDFVEFFSYCHQRRTKDSYRITRLDALYLYLIAEKLDENSSLQKFIKTMPFSFDTPEYFEDELILCLPDYLREDVQARLRKLNLRFNSILQYLKNFQASLCGANNKTVNLLVNNINFDLFRWAFCSVNSRCFHIKEKEILNQDEFEITNKLFGKLNTIKESNLKYCESLSEFERQSEANDEIRNNLCCLIPFLDFMNHSFSPNSFAQFDMEKKLFIIKSQLSNEESSEYPIEECFPIKENNQVYITYGYHENKTLLIEYGFILNENIYDKVLFKYKDFSELLENGEYLDIMWRKSIEDQLLVDFSCNSSTGPSWFLLKMLDLISFINNSRLSDIIIESPKKKIKSKLGQIASLVKTFNYSDESLNHELIKPLFVSLLNKYKTNLELSITRLENYKTSTIQKNNYHVDMSIEFCKLQLEIIEFNLTLANDSESWKAIF
jgi:hypothetical protein